ncbi:phosphatase PAP2 family protein [Hymenobacter sp. BT175]|uniref:phosphatase PAP2 family protein n=1 Tax=Hymenobacter translucens TaxID=2886507 RepID=UPI001D0DF21E|nr:phosphatase PAP2 family protein [Hymenobacter translucens]MCC2545405.1 phosphatase PAP2 family protein [Hymenobacter translucens]
MKLFVSLWLAATLLLAAEPGRAQSTPSASPYHTRLLVDGAIITGLTGIGVTGLYLVQQKRVPTEAELALLRKSDVPRIDRFVAGRYSERAQLVSDLLFYPTMGLAPGVLALNPASRGRFGQVAVLYVEAMMATNAIFASTVGTTYRYRPYLYGPEGGSRRTQPVATNSFFGGHTANSATVTFFTAKVLHDFNPGSAAEPYIWTAAAVLPAAVAYARMEAGKHFLTDNIVGYAVGATVGIMVPQLHKARGAGYSFAPVQGLNVNGHSYGGLLISKRL